MPQCSISFTAPPLEVNPLQYRDEPRLWFRRLTIWRKLAGDDSPEDPLIRNIEFKPGLNIVWSHQLPGLPYDVTLPLDPGKSTLVRLLRCCLGEDQFGIAEDEEAIRTAFPKGAVGAVIHVDGKPWSIVRSFRNPKIALANCGDQLDDLWAKFSEAASFAGITPFLEAIRAALFPNVSPDRFRDIWGVILGFIARDHSGGFQDVLRGRAPHNNSGKPTAQETRVSVLCDLLGFQTPQPPGEQANPRPQKASPSRASDRLMRATMEDISRRQKITNGEHLPISEMQARLNERREKTLISLGEAEQLKVNAEQDCEAKQRDRKILADEFAASEKTLDSLAATKSDLTAAIDQLKQNLIAPGTECRACNLPVDEAIGKGCLMPSAGCDPSAIAQRIADKEAQLIALVSDISEHDQRMKELKRQISAKDKEIKQVTGVIGRHELRVSGFKKTLGGIESDRSFLVRLEDMKQLARGGPTPVAATNPSASDSHRHPSETELEEKFNKIYQQVVGELISTKAAGAVTFKFGDVDLQVIMQSEQHDSLVSLLKLLAFDLAVLLASMQIEIPAPGLLIHDSPRVDDMPDDQYSKLFELASKLELVNKGRQLHQYIITTTTPPPDHLRSGDCLRLELNAQSNDCKDLLFGRRV